MNHFILRSSGLVTDQLINKILRVASDTTYVMMLTNADLNLVVDEN